MLGLPWSNVKPPHAYSLSFAHRQDILMDMRNLLNEDLSDAPADGVKAPTLRSLKTS
jgi:hypothetical protein